MGSSEDSFCLKWNDFHTSVTSSFADLLSEKDLFDITIMCDGGRPIRAHKLILSACSNVFKKMIRTTNGARDPTVLLWDIKSEDMEALIRFMYHGEVNITQEKLNRFLDLAEKLQVKGLTSSGDDKDKNALSRSSLPLLPKVPVAPPLLRLGQTLSANSAAKRPKLMSNSTNNDNDLKTEDNSDNEDGEQFGSSFNDEDSSQGGYSMDNDLRGGLPPLPQFVLDTPSMQINHVEPIVGPDGSKEYPCAFCEKKYITRARLKRHVLDCHERGEFPCPACGKIFTSARRLKDHQRSRYCHGQQQQMQQQDIDESMLPEPSVELAESNSATEVV